MFNFPYLLVVLLLCSLTGCGTSEHAPPEGFTKAEWLQIERGPSELAQAHRWIDQSSIRRKQRNVVSEACFRAFAHSHKTPEDILEDLAARKHYYRQINSTWLPGLALKAQRGEGAFGALLALQLEAEAQRCWNPKSAEILRQAAQSLQSHRD